MRLKCPSVATILDYRTWEEIDMNKRIAELLGGVAALVTLNAAQAVAPTASSQTETLAAQSYAELLNPVPNAVPSLIADDARRAQQRAFRRQFAQYHHHHHHHHHNGFSTTTGVLGAIGIISTMQPGYAPAPSVSPVVANCIRQHKSYDPQSGTYADKSGNRHPCP
jgi:BA14K-like protein